MLGRISGLAFREQKTLRTCARERALAKPFAAGDDVQIFVHEEHRVAYIHRRAAYALVQAQLIARVRRRARIGDGVDLRMTRQQDEHPVLVANRDQPAQEPAPFLIERNVTLAEGRLLDVLPAVGPAHVLNRELLDLVERLDDQGQIFAAVVVEMLQRRHDRLEGVGIVESVDRASERQSAFHQNGDRLGRLAHRCRFADPGRAVDCKDGIRAERRGGDIHGRPVLAKFPCKRAAASQ